MSRDALPNGREPSFINYNKFVEAKTLTEQVKIQPEIVSTPSPPRPKILFVAPEDWFFASHFVDFARIAIGLGFKALFCGHLGARGKKLEDENIRCIDASNFRNNNLAAWIVSIIKMIKIIKVEDPSIIHIISLKSIILFAFLSKFHPKIKFIIAPTGLGIVWAVNKMKYRLARRCIKFLFSFIRGKNIFYIFENADDARSLGVRLDGHQAVLVFGSGVSASEFPAHPFVPNKTLRVAVVARLLRTKGIEEAVAAIRHARSVGCDVELDIFGTPDPLNPSSFTEADLIAWSNEPGIHWRGQTTEPSKVWADRHVAMLLSWGGEGLPRTLSEASASGRPIITTDVPGCRAVVSDGIEGFLVPPRDVMAAARAVIRLANDVALCERMGRAARLKFEAKLAAEHVHSEVQELYSRIM